MVLVKPTVDRGIQEKQELTTFEVSIGKAKVVYTNMETDQKSLSTTFL